MICYAPGIPFYGGNKSPQLVYKKMSCQGTVMLAALLVFIVPLLLISFSRIGIQVSQMDKGTMSPKEFNYTVPMNPSTIPYYYLVHSPDATCHTVEVVFENKYYDKDS